MMQWYAHQLSQHPGLVVLSVLVATGTCILVSFTTTELPSFKDPLLGFEPRGTELAQRSVAWRNLLESSGFSGPLSMFPGPKEENVTRILHGESALFIEKENNDTIKYHTGESTNRWMALEQDEPIGRPIEWKGERRQELPPQTAHRNFFCNDPARAYAHIIFERVGGASLFSLESLQSLCQIQDEVLRASTHYNELCEFDAARQQCCRPWSLPNYVALLSGKNSCRKIKQQDINSVLELLRECAPYYHGMKLSHDCATDALLCRGVPRPCTEHNAVYHILHYLTDKGFLHPDNATSILLTYSALFLPIAQSTATMPYYKDVMHMQLNNQYVQMSGMQLGLKQALFDECLIHDTAYVGLAGLVIFILIWTYTTSFLVTLMTLTAVAFSLALAYFLYATVFKVTFFPFMNLLTVVIAIGIGADDAFIYCKIWSSAKAEKTNGPLVKLVKDTLSHACLSMLVTSATTAAAFFGSFITSITAVRCFSLFSGMAVLANLLFTVTCLPASVILSEKCCSCLPPVYLPPLHRYPRCSALCNQLWKAHYSCQEAARVFFEKILPCLVIRPRYLWLSLFAGLALAASVAVFYHPRLRLPDSPDFQIFGASHPFERYDLHLKRLFWFDQMNEAYHRLPVRIVWGVKPIDTGHYLNPFDRGALVLDEEFDMSAPASQAWLLSFCKALRNQSFYQSTLGPLLPNCFIEMFKSYMERRCVDTISHTDRTPCCEISRFPYEPEVFDLCIRRAISTLHTTPGYYFIPGVAGPRFSTTKGQIRAVVVEYDSVYSYSHSYNEMSRFHTEVETWVQSMMKKAPPGMKNGWFSSDLEFYDLQKSLAEGTIVAMGVAIGVSFVALLATTLNLLISLYATLTIACIMVVTVAGLVLLGWKLNILESITVSVAIGLAVDFTLHYGVAYRVSSQEERELSVISSLSRMGSPVAMGAFTTFLAGALMFPSQVLAYLQVATFLVLLTATSWIYATFFFQSLLSLAGPQKGQLQLSYPSLGCCRNSTPAPVPSDKPAYALSESTLSTSSASYVTPVPLNETHELEPLTDRKGKRSCSFSTSHHPPNLLLPSRSRKVSLPTVSVTLHDSDAQFPLT